MAIDGVKGMIRSGTLLISTLILLILTGCGPVQTDKVKGNDVDSGLSLDLPPRDGFDAEKQEVLTGFSLHLEPIGENCGDLQAQRIIGRWEDRPVYSDMLPDCDYRLALDLGTLSDTGQVVDPVFFTNRDLDGEGELVQHDDPGDGSKKNFQVKLHVTDEGVKAGFATGSEVDDPIGAAADDDGDDDDDDDDDDVDQNGWTSDDDDDDDDSVADDDDDDDDSTVVADDDDDDDDSSGNGSGNQLPPLSLSADQDVEFLKTDGSRVNLSDVFTASYLIIDFSSVYCSACLSLARDHQSDRDFAALFSGDQCRFATVVPERELSSWSSTIGSGFVTDNSVGYSGSQSGLGGAFGASINAIPNVIIIDREGNLVAQDVGNIPSEVWNLCTVP